MTTMAAHQPDGYLLNRLFRRKSKKTSKLRVTGLCVGPVKSPHKGPVTRKNVSIWWRPHDKGPETQQTWLIDWLNIFIVSFLTSTSDKKCNQYH